jgi:Flp pilus assembly protein TadD
VDDIPLAADDRRPADARWAPLLAGTGLAAAATAAYANTWRGPFVFLDVAAIENNPTIRQLWPVWGVLRPPLEQGLTVEGRPIFNLSLALNYALSGPRVWTYHAANLAIHAAAACALFGVVRRTLRHRGERQSLGLAFAAALLWTVHPLQTESVAYLVQRAESLMGLFYLLTLYCFVRGAARLRSPEASCAVAISGPGGRKSTAWLLLSFLCCLLGMGTKEVMASAPVIVLLYDRVFIGGSWREAWGRRWRWHLALAATWLLLAESLWTTGGDRGGTSGFGLGISWLGYLRTQFPAILHYLRLSLWPHPLVFYYEVHWWSWSQVALAALAVTGLAAASALAAWRGSAVGFLGVFFFAILAPTSLVPGLSQTLAEHRMYLALAPVLVAVVLAGRALGAALGVPRTAMAVLLLAGAAGLGAMTVRRNGTYRSEVALWSDTVAKAPGNPYTQNNLGIALAAVEQTPEAIRHFRSALQLRPGYAEAEDNLGLALAESGRLPEAIAHYEGALRLKREYPEARMNLGVALAASGRLGEARSQFAEAVALQPGNVEARNDLAVALARTGDLPGAIVQYEAALKANPRNAEMQYNLANALAGTGQWPKAIAHYEEALRLQPRSAEAAANLGAALANAGRLADAVGQYQRALALAPDDPDIHANLALALDALGRTAEAREQASASARLRSPR